LKAEDAGTPIREITAIFVSWRDTENLEKAVEALVRARARVPAVRPRVSVVIVDNGGALAEDSRIRALCSDVVWISNPFNRGLAAASNQAARATTSDVLLFLNPDTLAEGEPFSEIARAFEDQPRAVAVAPRLLEPEGESSGTGPLAPPDSEDQRTFQLRRLPSLSADTRQLLLIDHLVPDNAARRRERYAAADRETAFEVEQAAAAAFAIRREAFDRIGGFDERFFPAWFEDVDLCDRLRAVGSIMYWPSARFRHRGRTASEALGYDRFLPIYYTNALRYRSRYSLPARLSYRALLTAGMLLRLVAVPFRTRLPRPRGEAARAYLRTLGVAFGFPPSASRLPPPASP